VLTDPTGSYIVMEAIEGRTLQAAILEQGRLTGAGVALAMKGDEVVLSPGTTLSLELADSVRLTRPGGP